MWMIQSGARVNVEDQKESALDFIMEAIQRKRTPLGVALGAVDLVGIA